MHSEVANVAMTGILGINTLLGGVQPSSVPEIGVCPSINGDLVQGGEVAVYQFGVDIESPDYEGLREAIGYFETDFGINFSDGQYWLEIVSDQEIEDIAGPGIGGYYQDGHIKLGESMVKGKDAERVVTILGHEVGHDIGLDVAYKPVEDICLEWDWNKVFSIFTNNGDQGFGSDSTLNAKEVIADIIMAGFVGGYVGSQNMGSTILASTEGQVFTALGDSDEFRQMVMIGVWLVDNGRFDDFRQAVRDGDLEASMSLIGQAGGGSFGDGAGWVFEVSKQIDEAKKQYMSPYGDDHIKNVCDW